jgi:hypothetical protein
MRGLGRDVGPETEREPKDAGRPPEERVDGREGTEKC